MAKNQNRDGFKYDQKPPAKKKAPPKKSQPAWAKIGSAMMKEKC